MIAIYATALALLTIAAGFAAFLFAL